MFNFCNTKCKYFEDFNYYLDKNDFRCNFSGVLFRNQREKLVCPYFIEEYKLTKEGKKVLLNKNI